MGGGGFEPRLEVALDSTLALGLRLRDVGAGVEGAVPP